jgi:uncharacterized membrane protein
MRMKKKIIAISILGTLALAPFFAFAQAASGTIQMPSDMTAQILAQATALLGSLSSYMELIIGVLLALVVVEFVIGAIRHRQ